MESQLASLLARWDSNDGKPYKGSLIDWDSYQSDPENIGCMCAQGQVLRILGGWSPEQLRDTEQAKADRDVAKLLGISLGHAILLRGVNDGPDGAPSIVLTDPAKVIGDQAGKVLDFWHYLDGMSAEQWDAARDTARDAAWDAATAAAWYAATAAATAAAWDAAWDAATAAATAAASYAVGEIMGARILREQGKPFFFLAMFGFSSPEEIPARPADYGKLVEA